MIYLKNNAETQEVFIPKQNVVTNLKPSYKDGYRDGLQDGKKQQKDQLLNLYITENGQYEREDGWGVVTVDMSVPDCSGAYDEGYNQGYEDGQNSVECPESGTCNLGEGEVLLDTTMAGTYELYASDDGYDGWSKFYVTLENGGAIKIHKAEELIQMFNEGWGIDFGGYYYVGGEITEVQEINTQYGNATYVLDNGFKVYRGDWIDGNPFGEDQIKVGAYIVVYGIIQDYKGQLQFKVNSQVIAYQECEGGEIVSCNLEDKGVNPSINDRDGNGVIVITPSENYDGLLRVVLDPTTIYNEGIEEGRNQGGGSGDCNIQNQKKVDLNSSWEVFYPDEGYDGIYEVIVQADAKVEEWREEGRYDVRNKLQSIEITENGRYSTEDTIYIESLRYNGGYHTDTISTYDINRIEVTFKADTSVSINGQGQPFILGGSMWGLSENSEDNECARAIQYAYGRIVGYWEGKCTSAVTTMDGEWITITLDENGMTVKYPTYEEYCNYIYDNGSVNGGGDLFPFIIGGQGRRSDADENGNRSSNLIEDTQFRGLIKEVKVNTNSMGEITYIPKNWGYGVWDRKVENTGEYLSSLEPTEGEVTMNSVWENKYGEGWREINVNVDTQESYNQGFADATSFNKIAMEIETDAVSKLEFLTDHSFATTNGDNSPKSLMFDMPINYIWSYRDVSDGIAELKQNAFRSYGSIRKVKLNTIMTLGERAFKGAYNLQEIDMSNLIGNIATEAFDGCSKLAKIICRTTGSVLLGSAPFNGLPENGVLYLAEGVDETPWLEKLPSGWAVERI